MGPVGLLIAALNWNGLAIDKDFKIWQYDEEPIDLVNTPYQSIQPQLLMMVARAITIAEWNRMHQANNQTRGLGEIEHEASQLHAKSPAEEKGMVRRAQMGGSMAKQDIAKYNEVVDEDCNYCTEAKPTANHIRLQCAYFDEDRKELDPELAAVPLKYLLHFMQCG